MNIEDLDKKWRRACTEAKNIIIHQLVEQGNQDMGEEFVAACKAGSLKADRFEWQEYLQILEYDMSLTPNEDWNWHIMATQPHKLGILEQVAQDIHAGDGDGRILLGWTPQVRGKTKENALKLKAKSGKVFFQEETGMLIGVCPEEDIPPFIKNYMVADVDIKEKQYQEKVTCKVAAFAWNKNNFKIEQ